MITKDEFLSMLNHLQYYRSDWEAIKASVEEHWSESNNAKLPVRCSAAIAIVQSLSDWSNKYPRGRIYHVSKMSMDDELVAIEEAAKSYITGKEVGQHCT